MNCKWIAISATVVCVALVVACNEGGGGSTSPAAVPAEPTDALLGRAQDLMTEARREGGAEKYEEALAILDRALELDPDDVNVLLAAADARVEVFIRSSLFDENGDEAVRGARRAEALYRKAIEVAPDDARTHAGIAQYLDLREDYEGALAELGRALELNPEDSELLYPYGNTLDRLQRHDEAEEVFLRLETQANEAGDEFALKKAQDALGAMYMRRGRLDLAKRYLVDATEGLAELNRTTEATPFVCPYEHLGVLYTLTGMQQKAADEMSHLADASPTRSDFQFEAALSAYAKGDFTGALVYSTRAMENTPQPEYEMLRDRTLLRIRKLNPGEPIETANFAYDLALLCFGVQRLRKAIHFVDSAIALHDCNEYRLLRKNILLQMRDLRYRDGRHFEGAYSRRGKAAGIRPEDEFSSALRFFAKGDYLVADAFADTALSLKPDPRYRVVKGFLLMMGSQFDSAREQFEAADRAPTRDAARVGLGHLASVAGDHDAAERFFRPVLSRRPESACAADDDASTDERFRCFVFQMACVGLGWDLGNRNRNADAIRWFEAALSANPGNLLALLGKGNAELRDEHLDDAERTFQHVLSTDPDNPYALASLGLIRLQRGDGAAAEEAFQQALVRDADGFTCPYEGLGLLYLSEGRREKAQSTFETATGIQAGVLYRKFNALAKMHIREGRLEQAEILLGKSIESHPEDNPARELLDCVRAFRSDPFGEDVPERCADLRNEAPRG